MNLIVFHAGIKPLEHHFDSVLYVHSCLVCNWPTLISYGNKNLFYKKIKIIFKRHYSSIKLCYSLTKLNSIQNSINIISMWPTAHLLLDFFFPQKNVIYTQKFLITSKNNLWNRKFNKIHFINWNLSKKKYCEKFQCRCHWYKFFCAHKMYHTHQNTLN